jgi:hypothetical protein
MPLYCAATLAMTHASAVPRCDTPGLDQTSPPGGRGECRVLGAPAASRAMKKAHELVTTGPPESPGIPAREWFYGFLRALPGDRAFFVTIASGSSRQLDAGVEASGPHDFAVRLDALRPAHSKRPSHPAPNVS